jgi:MYXO-CTERM domain-containing protein
LLIDGGRRSGAAVVIAAALGALLGSACSPAVSRAERGAAITNGSDDAGDPGVVALVDGSTLVCTATLIAPRLLVTAAHCLPDGATPRVYFGSAPGDGGPEIDIATVRRHPTFDAETLDNDIALALLAEDAPAGATPWPLPAAPLDASAVGATLRLVGFGRSAAGDGGPPQKRVGTATLTSLDPTTLGFSPSPSQTCEGDSGGPAFATIGGVEAIVGVTSSGDAACAASARDMRIDAYQAAFIAPFVAATAAHAAGPGERCWYDENCATGAGECASALDDPTLSFCAPSCDGGCPAELSCLAGGDGRRLCRHAAPSPGAQGSPCSSDEACVAGRCVAPGGGGKGGGGAPVCAATCFDDLPGFCAAGFDCAPVAGGESSACFARTAGGCAFAATPVRASTAALFAVTLVVLALGLRRRRRHG